MMDNRVKFVSFAEPSLKKAFEELGKGRFEEKKLAANIQSAIDELKKNPFAGEKIPHKLWPKLYLQKYGIDNLRKIDLPDGWRLLYALRGNKIEVVSVILEWMSHKQYEKRFRYNVK